MLQCRQLLSADLELVRKGDIYSLMIEFFMKNNNLNAATQLAIEMKKNLPNDNLAHFIPKGYIRHFIYTKLVYSYIKSVLYMLRIYFTEAIAKLGLEDSSNDRNSFHEDFDEIPDITQ